MKPPSDGAVVFAGSGISIFDPVTKDPASTSWPAGGTVTLEITNRLLASFEASAFEQQKIREASLELILDNYPNKMRAQEVFAKFYLGNHFNGMHLYLAKLAHSGAISAIVTTNYDRGIENALTVFSSETPSFFHAPLIRESDRAYRGFPVFKIHGCASSPESVCVTLRSEVRLPVWKKDLLVSLCRGREVYILGYSGRDFDVCPELISTDCSPKLINWLEFQPKENWSVLQNEAHRRGIATIECASFDSALPIGHLPRSDASQALAKHTAAKLAAELFKPLSVGELQAWRFALLERMGLARAMEAQIAAAVLADAVDPATLLHWESDLAERKGRYVESAHKLSTILRSYRPTGTAALTVSRNRVGRHITSQHLIRFLVAWLFLEFLVMRLRSNAGSAYAWYTRGFVFQRIGGVMGRMVPSLGKKLRRAAFGRFAAASALFQNEGLWHDVALCTAQIEKLAADDPRTASARPNTAAHLTSGDSFRQLASFIGEVTYRRTWNPGYYADPAKVAHDFEILREQMLFPEIWKIAALPEASQWAMASVNPQELFDQAFDALSRTQLPWYLRKRYRSKIKRNQHSISVNGGLMTIFTTFSRALISRRR
jgi:hypothetical protein